MVQGRLVNDEAGNGVNGKQHASSECSMFPSQRWQKSMFLCTWVGAHFD